MMSSGFVAWCELIWLSCVWVMLSGGIRTLLGLIKLCGSWMFHSLKGSKANFPTAILIEATPLGHTVPTMPQLQIASGSGQYTDSRADFLRIANGSVTQKLLWSYSMSISSEVMLASEKMLYSTMYNSTWWLEIAVMYGSNIKQDLVCTIRCKTTPSSSKKNRNVVDR